MNVAYQGSVPHVEDLPRNPPLLGSLFFVVTEETHYVWDGQTYERLETLPEPETPEELAEREDLIHWFNERESL